MNIYQKLQEARKIIREAKVGKEGMNDYSKYSYFTPEQVEGLVAEATEKTKTICLTSLLQDNLGYFQKLVFVDLEKPEDRIEFELRTAMPVIKATNETQQAGGMDTYSERYIKMKVFQIKDNNLDFDSQDNRVRPKYDYTNKKDLTPDQFGAPKKDPLARERKENAQTSAELSVQDDLDL